MELHLKCNKKCVSMTNGGGSGLKLFKVILFQHGTTSEMN